VNHYFVSIDKDFFAVFPEDHAKPGHFCCLGPLVEGDPKSLGPIDVDAFKIRTGKRVNSPPLEWKVAFRAMGL
jgi:hypothetical protein